MIKFKSNKIFIGNDFIDENLIIRKDATSERPAYYELIKNNIVFNIEDILGQTNPLLINNLTNENKLYIGDRTYPYNVKQGNQIIYSTEQTLDTNNCLTVNNIKNGLEIIIKRPINENEERLYLKLEAVGNVRLSNKRITLYKDDHTNFSITNIEIKSEVESLIPFDINNENEVEGVGISISPDKNEIIGDYITYSFVILSYIPTSILTMYSKNLDDETFLQNSGTIRAGRYVDLNRLSKSNADQLFIEINSDYIKNETKLKPKQPFTTILQLFHSKPIFSELIKNRTGYLIKVDEKERLIKPKEEGELLIDLTEAINNRIANDDWSPLTVSIKSADEEMYARLSGSQSGISNILTTDDYFEIYSLNNQDEAKHPRVLFYFSDRNQYSKETPLTSINNGCSGILEVNNFTLGYQFKHEHNTLFSNCLSIDLAHIFCSFFAQSEKGSNNTFGLGRGWKTNLHQWLKKEPYDYQRKELRVIYTDGENKNHVFYERWFYKLNGKKHYIDRSEVYLDPNGHLKYKTINRKIYNVEYEVRNDDGLTLITSSSLFGYRNKTKVNKIIKHYSKNNFNSLKVVSGLLEIPLRIIGSNTNLTFGSSSINWLNDNNLTFTTDDFLSNFSGKFHTYDLPLPYNNEYDFTLLLPILYNGSDYYVKYPSAKYELLMMNDYKESTETIDIYNQYQSTYLTTKNEYQFDTTIIDYFETDEIIHIKKQIQQNDQIIFELKNNAKNISFNIENIVETKSKLQKTLARIIVTINHQKDIYNKYQYPQIELKKASWYTLNENYNQIKEQIKSLDEQLIFNQKQLSIVVENLDRYELNNINLTEKLDYLINIQKLEPTDFIIDNDGSIHGFDYYGRLVIIGDKFGNKIKIKYKKELDLIDYIETKNGKTQFIYIDDFILEKIIDVDGKVTLFKYNNDNLLISIKYEHLSNNKADFEYFNEKLIKIKDSTGLELLLDSVLDTLTIKQQTNIEKINHKNIYEYENYIDVILDLSLNKTNLKTEIINNIKEVNDIYNFDDQGRVVSSINTIGNKNNRVFATYTVEGKLKVSSRYLDDYILEKFIENETTITTNRIISFSKNENSPNTIWIGKLLNTDTLVYYFDFKESEVIETINIEIEAQHDNGQVIKKNLELFNHQCHHQVPIPINKDSLISIKITTDNEEVLSNFGLASGYAMFIKYDKDLNISETVEGQKITSYLNYQTNLPTRIESVDRYGKIRFENYAYNSNNQVTYVEDQDGNIKENYYQDNGELKEEVKYNKKAPNNKINTKYTYDKYGNITIQSGLLPDKDGFIKPSERSFYEGTRKLKQTKLPNGLIKNYTYDFYYNNLVSLSSAVDGIANTVDYSYQNSFLTTLSCQEFDIHYGYDGRGRIKSVDIACNNIVKINYDDNYVVNGYKGLKTDVIYYNNEIIENQITTIKDIYGKIININDTLSLNTNYEYDSFNRITSIESDDQVTQNLYDLNGNLTNKYIKYRDFAWLNYNLFYDNKNQLTEVEFLTKTYINNNFENVYYYKTRFYYDSFKRIDQVHINYQSIQEKSDEKLTIEYDGTNRVTKERVHLKDSLDSTNKYQLIANEYLYLRTDNNATNLIKKNIQTVLNNIKDVSTYEYDEMGNIIKIENDDNIITYKYDKLSRLIRENNQKQGFSKTFEYDESGNIIRSKTYPYSIKELGESISNNKYSYNQGNYQDQLVCYNNEIITYDGLGRPTIYRDNLLEWSKRSTLSRFNNFNYAYNDEGVRISKTANGVFYKFHVDGFKIIVEERIQNDERMILKYKYFGDKIFGFNYQNVDYYYLRNILNDIVAIIDKNGNEVARYEYDAWGNHQVINLTSDNIGDVNPFRYRSYYFDIETQLYYLNSRYYDPEIGRFISQDNYSYLDSENVNGLNLYAYCLNNPIMGYDPTGTWDWGNFWKVVAGIGIVTALVVGTIFTGGTLSVVLAGAAIGAIGGAIGATVSTTLLNDWENFGNNFLIGTIGGAISGAVGASTISVLGQIGANTLISSISYTVSSFANGDSFTIGGLLSSALLGVVTGIINGPGMLSGKDKFANAFVAFGGKNFLYTMATNTGKTLLKQMKTELLDVVMKNIILEPLYSLIKKVFNSSGEFWGTNKLLLNQI